MRAVSPAMAGLTRPALVSRATMVRAAYARAPAAWAKAGAWPAPTKATASAPAAADRRHQARRAAVGRYRQQHCVRRRQDVGAIDLVDGTRVERIDRSGAVATRGRRCTV